MVEISKERLQELEDAEMRLLILERRRVAYWPCYEPILEEYNKYVDELCRELKDNVSMETNGQFNHTLTYLKRQ